MNPKIHPVTELRRSGRTNGDATAETPIDVRRLLALDVRGRERDIKLNYFGPINPMAIMDRRVA